MITYIIGIYVYTFVTFKIYVVCLQKQIIKTLNKNTMKNTSKEFRFIFIDIFGNDTEEKVYSFANLKEARVHAKNLLANANDNTEQILVKVKN